MLFRSSVISPVSLCRRDNMLSHYYSLYHHSSAGFICVCHLNLSMNKQQERKTKRERDRDGRSESLKQEWARSRILFGSRPLNTSTTLTCCGADVRLERLRRRALWGPVPSDPRPNLSSTRTQKASSRLTGQIPSSMEKDLAFVLLSGHRLRVE